MDTKEAIANELSRYMGLKKPEIIALLEKPKYANLGDWAFPCFNLAKVQKKSPFDIAMEIKEKFEILPKGIEKVDALGGYVNFFLDKKILAVSVLDKIAKEKEKYGSQKSKGKKIVIDYSSPNIAKPMTIGHLRATIIGNSLYKIYSFLGYKCVGINFLGDYGTQFGKLLVAYKKWGIKKEVEDSPIPALLNLYRKFSLEAESNPELKENARQEFKKLEKGDKENLALWRRFRQLSIDEFERFYNILGVKFDVYSGESFYSKDASEIIQQMKQSKIAVESQGALIVDLEKYNLSPLLIQKSDGASMYSSRDIAAAIDRYKTYKPDKILYVVASEQNLYFRQLFKTFELMKLPFADKCHHVSFGMIYMPEGGKVSSRKGEIIFLEDILEKIFELTRKLIENDKFSESEKEKIAKAVGISALIYSDLSNDRIKDVKFDWDKVLRLEGDSGPYLQYTYARAKSILAKAKSNIKKIREKDTKFSLAEEENSLIVLLNEFPSIVESAASSFSPHIIANYALKVSDTFNTFYEKCPVLKAEKEKNFRLALTQSIAQVLKNAMLLLGMIPLERM